MTENFFAQERLHFQPRVPQSLDEVEKLTIQPKDVGSAKETIASLFPLTAKHPLVHFKATEESLQTPLRVGVVLSGGQAPGGHNVITGLLDALKRIHPKSQLWGFLGGPSGIIENKHQELTIESVAPYRNTGGFDMVGSGRTKIETEEQLSQTLKNCIALKLDGLVIIGGDDSNTNAAILAEYFLKEGCKTCVIGVPKTIDGDLKNPYIATSFGFDTACKIYSEMIGNICRDALSAKKYTHFIKLMGRSASHIALECALQTHPNIALIGEEIASKKMTLKEIVSSICDVIVKRADLGKNYAVILIPEGLFEFIPEMKKLMWNQERDPHGNVSLSQIPTEQYLIDHVKEELKTRSDYKGKFSPLGHFLGYEGRCGYPSNFDTNYCYALGFIAAALIRNKQTGYMCGLQNLTHSPEVWEPIGVPLTLMMDLEERKGKQKPVIKKALVDLEGKPFKFFTNNRNGWALEDHYRFPGPIQFAGPSSICDAVTLTLNLQ